MNRFISFTIDGVKRLISVDEIRAVGFDEPTGKGRLVVDITRPDMAILVDQTVDQIEEALYRVAIVMNSDFPLMAQRDKRKRRREKR